MKQKYFLLLVMNLLLVRCVVFNNKSILVNVKQKHFQNGDSRDVYPRQEKKLRKKFAKILAESYLFKEVKTGLAVSDIQLRIEIDVKVVMDDLLFMLSCLTFQRIILLLFSLEIKKILLLKSIKSKLRKIFIFSYFYFLFYQFIF